MPYTTHYVRNYGSSIFQPWKWLKDVPTCDSTKQAAIQHAFDYIHRRLIPDVNALGEGCIDLATCLTGKTTATVWITCTDCFLPASGHANIGGSDMTICDSAFSSSWQEYIDATVFHELIHSCGGNQIDAYILEWYILYGHGTYYPTPADLQYLCDQGEIKPWWGKEYRFGKYVYWDSRSGRCWSYRLNSARPSGIQTPILPFVDTQWGWNHLCT